VPALWRINAIDKSVNSIYKTRDFSTSANGDSFPPTPNPHPHQILCKTVASVSVSSFRWNFLSPRLLPVSCQLNWLTKARRTTHPSPSENHPLLAHCNKCQAASVESPLLAFHSGKNYNINGLPLPITTSKFVTNFSMLVLNNNNCLSTITSIYYRFNTI